MYIKGVCILYLEGQFYHQINHIPWFWTVGLEYSSLKKLRIVETKMASCNSGVGKYGTTDCIGDIFYPGFLSIRSQSHKTRSAHSHFADQASNLPRSSHFCLFRPPWALVPVADNTNNDSGFMEQARKRITKERFLTLLKRSKAFAGLRAGFTVLG
jgi:hypothetical protein